jgi:hypothetical protein
MISQDQLLTTTVTGLTLWAATGTANFFLKRYYLCRALLSDMRKEAQRATQLKDYFLEYIGTSLKPGQVIDLSARFTKDEHSFLDDIRHELIQLLPRFLERVFAFYEAVEEMETLTENFFTEVTIWKNDKHMLTEADHLYLLGKVGRIIRLAELLNPKPFNKISDIPLSYDGRVKATRVLELTQRIYSGVQLARPEELATIIPGLSLERHAGGASNPGRQADGSATS